MSVHMKVVASEYKEDYVMEAVQGFYQEKNGWPIVFDKTNDREIRIIRYWKEKDGNHRYEKLRRVVIKNHTVAELNKIWVNLKNSNIKYDILVELYGETVY